MGKKNKPTPLQNLIRTKVHPRRLRWSDMRLFERKPRNYSCLCFRKDYQHLVAIEKLDPAEIRQILALQCLSIEHQIIRLRSLTQLTEAQLFQRRSLTRYFLDCLHKHHNTIYEGILFGSTVNGLGFIDSDLDLRLRPLKQLAPQDTLEPVNYDRDAVEATLRNIAYQTTRCAPAIGDFVPSSRCPIAKLTFLQGDPKNLNSLQEGANYDISLSSTNSLGSFNSVFMQFLCKLQPKFHLLATVLRYWSRCHKLILAGYLSSYALVNMLIFFCQSTSPPLLPTIDQMRDIYLAQADKKEHPPNPTIALTRQEWQCLVCLDKRLYPKSQNKEPLSMVLLKFFEFYLNFTYTNTIITTRTGRAISALGEFQKSNLFHPRYPVKEYINIQDPFDLKHNLTSGMTGEHFNLLMITIRFSYERLCTQLLTNFLRSDTLSASWEESTNGTEGNQTKVAKIYESRDPIDWGLNAIFLSLSDEEVRDAW